MSGKPAIQTDDENVIVVNAERTRPRRAVVVRPPSRSAQLPVPLRAPCAPPARRGWARCSGGDRGAWYCFGAGLGIVKLIEDLFARGETSAWPRLCRSRWARTAALPAARRFGDARLATISCMRARRVLASEPREAAPSSTI
jgi:putative membrane protein